MGDRLLQSLRYWRRVNKEAVQEGFFSWGIKMVLGFLIAGIIIFLQLHYGVINTTNMSGRWLSVVWPYVSILALGYLFHIARAAWRMHDAVSAELANEKNDRLISQSQYTVAIASLNIEVEKLKNEAASRRPTLTIQRYGSGGGRFGGMDGFWVVNGGPGAAINPSVERFSIQLFPDRNIFAEFSQRNDVSVPAIKGVGFIPVWGRSNGEDGKAIYYGLWDAMTYAERHWSEADGAGFQLPRITIKALDYLGRCFYTTFLADAAITTDAISFELIGIGECESVMPQQSKNLLSPVPQSLESSTTHD